VTAPEEPYGVAWAGPARHALARMPENVARAAIEFIYGRLAENPHRLGHTLRFDLEGLHSARRGDHRIVYRIDECEHRVVIEVIDHRGDIYRPR
jgi:mRNA interferase RelE/StbE